VNIKIAIEISYIYTKSYFVLLGIIKFDAIQNNGMKIRQSIMFINPVNFNIILISYKKQAIMQEDPTIRTFSLTSVH
jgi:hypothetical protein